MPFMWGLRLSASAVPPGEDGSSSADCNATYRGPTPGSEPENQALADYMAQVFRDQRGDAVEAAAPSDAEGLFISIHSTAASNLYPWTFDESIEAPNMPELRRLARKLSYYNLYPAPEDYTANANGIHHDYAYAVFGVASFTIELDGADFFQDCESFEGSTTRFTLTADVSDGRFGLPTAAEEDEPVQDVVAARYSIGQPSWVTGSTVLPMTAGDGAYDGFDESVQAELDTAALPAGRHLVFVEAQDAEGNWGLPSAVFLNVSR